ncbi:MAG: hypothetical protein ACOC46_02125, partial [Pirellulales bacterium]
TYDNPETNRDYRVALRVFGKHVVDPEDVETDDNGIPVSLAWVSSKTPKSYDPSPNPAQLLDWDDVDALADAARNTRDAAMVQLMMDAGPRGGEFFDLEVGDITNADHGLQVWIDGKTGQGKYTIYVGGNLLGTRINSIYKDLVPAGEVVSALVPLFLYYKRDRRAGESLGDFCHRKGVDDLLQFDRELNNAEFRSHQSESKILDSHF